MISKAAVGVAPWPVVVSAVALSLIVPDAGVARAEQCSKKSPAACVAAANDLESSDDATVAGREQAVVLYRQGCNWGHAPACVLAGRRLRNGKSVAHDPAAAAGLFRTACESGNGEACNMLGIMHSSGEGGLSADLTRSRQLYQQACSDGWAWGCYNLAVRMRDGEGGDQDLSGAASNFAAACDGGVGDGCNAAGIQFWGGKGVAKDLLRANKYFTKGCDDDTAWACYNLATSYRNGEGVPAKNLVRATALLRKGCDLGAARACNLAAIMYNDGETGDEDLLLAFGLFHKACDDGHYWGCHNLAGMYRKGRGIGQDEERAVTLFRKACDGGIEDACEAIGVVKPPAAAEASPVPQPTATPRPRATPTPQPTRAPNPRPPASQWLRNCQVVWKSSNELVYTVSTQVTDGIDGATSLHTQRSDLVALLNDLDLSGEPDLEKSYQAALRAIENAPAYDNPVPSHFGGSSADMTMSPALETNLDDLWVLVTRRAKANGKPCAHLRFATGDDGVMYDSATGLEWRAGVDERTTWEGAKAWVEDLATSEKGWRLPTNDELLDLHSGGLRPGNMNALLGVDGSWLWSATESAGSWKNWGLSFNREGSMAMTGCNFCDSRAIAVRVRP